MCLAEGHNAVTPVRTNNLDLGQAHRSVWPESVSKLHKLSTDDTRRYIWESPPKFDNRIMARVYVKGALRSILLAGTCGWKIESVACGFSSIQLIILIIRKV